MSDEDVVMSPFEICIPLADSTCPDTGLGTSHGPGEIADVDVGFMPAILFIVLAIGIGVYPKFDGAAHRDDIAIKQETGLIFAALTGDGCEQQEKEEAEGAGHHVR